MDFSKNEDNLKYYQGNFFYMMIHFQFHLDENSILVIFTLSWLFLFTENKLYTPAGCIFNLLWIKVWVTMSDKYKGAAPLASMLY